MITYEMIKTAGDKVSTMNMIFLPPMGIRLFNLNTLMPHSVKTSGVLANQVHNLWELLLGMYKIDNSTVSLKVTPGKLTIVD